MPLLSLEKEESKVLILWELLEDVDDFKALVSEFDFNRVLQSNHLKKRQLEKLSQVAMLNAAGIDNSDLTYSSNGKPILSNNKCISFSHSGQMSAVLLNENPCGLDIELPSEKIIRISGKFLNQVEVDFMKDPTMIYWAWSIKEAVFKYFGENVIFKDHIQINSLNPDKNIATVYYNGYHGKGTFELHLSWIKKYYLAYTKTYSPE